MARNGSIFIFFLLFYIKSFGQTFGECFKYDRLFTRVEHPSQFVGSMQHYFEQEFDGKLKDFEGEMLLTVFIDSVGRPCCLNIVGNTSNISSANIRQLVNQMPLWTPATQNGYPVNYEVKISITCIDSMVTIKYLNGEHVAASKTKIKRQPIILRDKDQLIMQCWNENNSMLPSNDLRNICKDDSGNIWICSRKGLVEISNGVWRVLNSENVPELGDTKGSTVLTGMSIDKKNNIWIESNNRIVRYDGSQWTSFDNTNSPLQNVTNICADNFGNVWFCSLAGLVKFDGRDWQKFNRSNSGISSDTVKEVFVDNQHIVWVATANGLSEFDHEHWKVFNTINSKIPVNDISSVKGDSKGSKWFSGGIRDKNYLITLDSAGEISFFLTGVIWNISIDDIHGLVWLATFGKGLGAFNGKEITYYNQTNSILPASVVSDVYPEKDDAIWISTFSGLVYAKKKYLSQTFSVQDTIVYADPDIPAFYFFGENSWLHYVDTHIINPKIDDSYFVKVSARVLISETGVVTAVTILDGPANGGFREEAIRLIKNSGLPKKTGWRPAIQDGRKVKSFKTVEIEF